MLSLIVDYYFKKLKKIGEINKTAYIINTKKEVKYSQRSAMIDEGMN